LEDVADTIARSIEAGAIGCNLEDSFPATGELRTVDDAAARLVAARQAADRADIGYFINARTDVFFKAAADTHDERLLDDVLTRARAYAA
ncbi:isocitrate lyase/phosphoenolpyruvate mutase family protein, partial [Paraburkholderia sp. SIMBA_009]